MNTMLSDDVIRFNGNNYSVGDCVVVTKCKNTDNIGKTATIRKIYRCVEPSNRSVEYFTILFDEVKNSLFPLQRDSYSVRLSCDDFDITSVNKYQVTLI